MEIPRAHISASTSIDRSLIQNFHVMGTMTNVTDWLSC